MYELKRYLVVDDDSIFRMSLARYFSVFAEVAEAQDLASAKVKITNERFDVILLDKELPDGNSLQLLALIKEKLPACVVVMVSGDSNLAPIYQAVDLGIDDYVVKSDNTIPDLMVRIPLATKRHGDRLHREESKDRPGAKLPRDMSEVDEEAFEEYMKSAEKEYLERVLSLSSDDLGSVAKLLGLARSTLHKKMSDFGVKRFPRMDA